MLGSYFAKAPSFSSFERLYIRLFGMPILGLRIRAWHMLPKIKDHLKNAASVLDVGAGRGVFTLEIAKQNPKAQILGVDLIPEKVDAANALAKELKFANCQFECVDLFSKKFSRRYDVVVAIDILEHVEKDAEFVARIWQILEKNGTFIVHVPNYYRNLFGVKRVNFDIDGHVRPGYHLADTEDLLLKVGFNIVSKGYTYSSFETLGNDIAYIVTKGRESNKFLYALIFPFLLLVARFGHYFKPKFGSGVFIIGQKKDD